MQNIGKFFYTKDALIKGTDCGPNFEGVIADESLMVVSKDVDPTKGSKCFAIVKREDLFNELYGKDKSYYEVVYTDGIPVKAYFDYDKKVENPSEILTTDEEKWAHIQPVADEIAQFFETMCGMIDTDYIVYESCTTSKISFHIIFPDCVFKNISQHKLFYENMPKNPHIDGLVYTKFRSFRLPFCKKLSAK